MIRVVDIDTENREAWLGWRRGGIGASEAAALLGVSPWASAISVYADKTGDKPPKELEGEHLDWGHLLETPILDEFQRRHDMAVPFRQVSVQHPDRPYMRATLDGLAVPTHLRAPTFKDALGVVEVKVAGSFTPWEEPPLHYQAQVAWQLAVTGLERGWLVALFGARKMVVYPIEADPTLTADLYEVAARFWERVETRTPPPALGHEADRDALARMFPKETPDSTVEVERHLVEAVREARLAEKHAKTVKEEAEARLKMVMGDASTAVTTIDGVEIPLATWNTQTRRSADTEALFMALGLEKDDKRRDQFMKESSSRVLRLKTVKAGK